MAVEAGELKGRLDDLRPLLEVVGAFVVSEAQRAFDDQQWDQVDWPPRYPFQRDRQNFVNVAGLLQHLNEGGRVLDRFFDDRPALMGTGRLRASIASRVTEASVVEVGSNLDYAAVQNEGGTTRQPISDQARAAVRRLVGRRPELGSKLRRLLEEDELVTEVVGRRFIGVNDRLEADVAAEVELWLSRE